MPLVEKIAIALLCIAGVVVLVSAIVALGYSVTASSWFLEIFARPTNIGGPLDWGPSTVAGSWVFEAFGGAGYEHVLTKTMFFAVVSGLLVLTPAYWAWRFFYKLVSA